MEVLELVELAKWYQAQVPDVRSAYAALLGLLQNNASQGTKQPLEADLIRLIELLGRMTFDELSLEQLGVLDGLDVRRYFGSDGVAFLDSTVKTSAYDPATAVTRVQEATTSIDNATEALSSYVTAIERLDLASRTIEDRPQRVIVRVGFHGEADIGNVAEWRDAGRDWYDIIRGLAMAAKESPEDTLVVGASTGSVVLILATTLKMASLLALIAKCLTSTAKDIITVAVTREDLRQKKLLSKTMELEFKKLDEKTRADGVKLVISQLKKHLASGALGDIDVAVEASVKKFLDFNEKGGTVDFVSPSEDEGAGNQEHEAADSQLLAQAREAIHAYQSEREALRLLVDGRDADSGASRAA